MKGVGLSVPYNIAVLTSFIGTAAAEVLRVVVDVE